MCLSIREEKLTGVFIKDVRSTAKEWLALRETKRRFIDAATVGKDQISAD